MESTLQPSSPSDIYVYSDKNYDDNYDIIFNKIDNKKYNIITI